jgi:hypothetical protein
VIQHRTCLAAGGRLRYFGQGVLSNLLSEQALFVLQRRDAPTT